MGPTTAVTRSLYPTQPSASQSPPMPEPPSRHGTLGGSRRRGYRQGGPPGAVGGVRAYMGTGQGQGLASAHPLPTPMAVVRTVARVKTVTSETTQTVWARGKDKGKGGEGEGWAVKERCEW